MKPCGWGRADIVMVGGLGAKPITLWRISA